MPAMRPNCRSRGVATAEAMVSGLAPGSPAPTWITGNSTWGSGATGRKLKASAPDNRSANVSSDVPIGLLINGAEIFIRTTHVGPDVPSGQASAARHFHFNLPPPILQPGAGLQIVQIAAQCDQTTD